MAGAVTEAVGADAGAYDLSVRLDGIEAWAALMADDPRVLDGGLARAVAERAQREGIVSRFFGAIPGREVSLVGPSLREGLIARALNTRLRDMIDAVAEEAESRGGASECRVWAAEAFSSFARLLRGRYTYCALSEFFADAAQARHHFPIQHADLCANPFPDQSFDVVVSNDVLEHVPDLDAALRESARVLRPGGVMLASFPFTFGPASLVRARLEDGRIVHLTEPEYHGDPLRGGGALVFEIPGWDILARARAAGFSHACMVFSGSGPRGLTADGVNGVLHLRAER